MEPREIPPPPPGTVERWAFDLVTTRALEAKLAPPPPPARWERDPPPRRPAGPGRPPELRVAARSARTPRPGALVAPAARARLFATFLHHELQAAELFAFALLAFPGEPRALRRGFLRLAEEELAHLALYRAHLEALGGRVGQEPVRDWFWERLGGCSSAAQFLAAMGIGLEGGNLEHSRNFAERLRAAGDPAGAAILERVAREEEGHVRFATTWFARLAGRLDFETWRAALPRPLYPGLLRGEPLARDARRRAGLDERFLEALEGWRPGSPGRLGDGAR